MELDIQKRRCCRPGSRPARVLLAEEMGSWLPRQKDGEGHLDHHCIYRRLFQWDTNKNYDLSTSQGQAGK